MRWNLLLEILLLRTSLISCPHRRPQGSVYYPLLRSRPIGYLTFALNYRFHGLNVTGYHIINLLIHIMNAVLVYFLVLFTFRTPYFRNHNSPSPPLILEGGVEGGGVSLKSNLRGFAPTNNVAPFTFHSSLLIPLAVALIFVAHPVQTEAVTYVFQRLASLVSMFYLLSLVLYIKGRLSVQKSEVKSQKLDRNTRFKTQNSTFFHLVFVIFCLRRPCDEDERKCFYAAARYNAL